MGILNGISDEPGTKMARRTVLPREISSLHGPSQVVTLLILETQSFGYFLSFWFCCPAQMKCSPWWVLARWNPSTDPHISMRETLRSQGKMANKHQKATGGIPHQVLCSASFPQSWLPLTITSLNCQGIVRPLYYRGREGYGETVKHADMDRETLKRVLPRLWKGEFWRRQTLLQGLQYPEFWDIQELWRWWHECRVATFFLHFISNFSSSAGGGVFILT